LKKTKEDINLSEVTKSAPLRSKSLSPIYPYFCMFYQVIVLVSMDCALHPFSGDATL